MYYLIPIVLAKLNKNMMMCMASIVRCGNGGMCPQCVDGFCYSCMATGVFCYT